jgi:hypothetical protein
MAQKWTVQIVPDYGWGSDSVKEFKIGSGRISVGKTYKGFVHLDFEKDGKISINKAFRGIQNKWKKIGKIV